MRKSLIAIAIGAAVSVAACSDQDANSTAGQNAQTEQSAVAEFNQSNPFYAESTLPFLAPDFTKIKFEHYKPAFLAGIEAHAKEVEAIANNSEPATVENTLAALEKSGALLGRVSAAFYNVVSAAGDDKMSALQGELAPMLSAHRDNISLNANLFARVKSIYDNRAELTGEDLRLAEETYKSFVRSGAELNDAEKAEIREINTEISSLMTEFQRNLMTLLDENLIIVDTKEELAGLSESAINSAATAATNAGHEGKYAIRLVNTTRHATLASLENRELRQRIWETSAHRGSGNTATDNRPLVKRLTELRAKKAELLGYQSWAHYVLADNMAGSPETALAMFHDLVPAVVEGVEAEQAAIQAMIEREGGDFEVQPWDWAYYAEKVRTEKYAIDSSEVKKYFEFNRVIEDGVFFAMNKLYGVTFTQRDDIPTYADNIRVYEVADANGEVLGLFYGDWFTRDGKRGGAWMNSFVKQSHLLDNKPVVLNNMNIIKAADGPTLLSFDEATTAFHEMGHAMHGLFSDVMYPSLSGTSVPRDFVEFPSQFEEDWILDDSVLNNFAVHYETGEPIPQELMDKILAAKNFNMGYNTLEYMASALLDLGYNTLSSDEAAAIDDVIAFEAKVLEENGVAVDAIAPRYKSTYFAHVFSGGYSAGYYAYLWSEMLAADAFAHMQNNGGLTRENGDNYREFILSKGNSNDLMTQYKKFRGGKPEVDALLIRRGLAEEK